MTEVTDTSEGQAGVLPPELRLGAVRLQVSDLQRSVAWYERVLGLSVLSRRVGEAALAPAAADAPLIQLRERPGARPAAPHSRLGLYHYALLLPDRAALGRFVAHCSRTGVRLGAGDHLVSEALYLQDPDGLGIEVYADRPRSSWRYRNGQLVMATDPLDIGDLVTAAGGESWAGMPAGSVLGHMHLHVGDLEQAAAYYHSALGLQPTVWSYPGALFLSAGGYHHHLGLNTWARGAPPAAEDDARLLEWEIVLPASADVQAVLQRLERASYSVERDGASGRSRDPWGTALVLRSSASPA